MSNPAKSLKKALPKIVKVVAIAAIAYAAFPIIASAMSSGGAASAASTVSGAASTAGGMGAAGAAAGTTAAAAGGGLLSGAGGALAAGASKIGGAIAGASPMVKLGLIQAGTQFAAGALTPEPQTAAEQQAELMALRQSQDQGVRNYSAGQSGVQMSAGQQEYTPVQSAPQAGLIGSFNKETNRWERA